MWSACESLDGALDLAGIAHVERSHCHPERRRHSLDDSELGGLRGASGIPKDRHSGDVWRYLLEQLQPFSANTELVNHETSGIAAWTRQTFDGADANRIGGDRKHNRHGAGRL